MYLTIRGLVLRITDYNDRDALLTLLTGSHGKLTVKARGLRRRNSPLAGVCQLLTLGEFTLFEYKGMYTINEAVPVEPFLGLRQDLERLALGTYFAQAAEVMSQEDLPNPELLSLTLNCLHALTALSLPETMVKAVFELRGACLAGYTPDLTGCHVCGRPDAGRFDLSAGHLECAGCRDDRSGGLRMPVTPGELAAMRYLCSCPAKKIFSFRMPEERCKGLARVTEAYLATQLERGFSTLDFYKSLLMEGIGDNHV